MSKRIVILGAGESGTGAALLAKAKGFDVFLSDKGEIKPKYKEQLLEQNIPFEEKQHTEELILNADEIIKSPGIPDKAELIKTLRKKGIPIISEIEFASRYTNKMIIAITGSNGKSTTTKLTHHILTKGGIKAALGGNIGYSFARLVMEDEKYTHYVLELSSFQLDDIKEFRPHIAVLLNITPDHLDRYEYEFENYIKSKFRITMNQRPEDYFIYCDDDEVVTGHMASINIAAKKLPFSITHPVEEGAWLEESENEIHFDINKNPITMTNENFALSGKHNLYNSMASGIIGRIVELRKDIIRDSMQDFKNLEHRLEVVNKISGVTFINDSKATNVNSTWYALESMQSPVVWIAGGVDKGNDYSVLVPLVSKKVKAIVCLGIENMRIHEAFSRHVDLIVNTQSMKEAVNMAHHLAAKDETVLLSPACASFDLFENYEDRGNKFKEAVREL